MILTRSYPSPICTHTCLDCLAWRLPLQDLDGSLTGFAGGWTSPFYKWHLVSNACWQGGLSVDSGIICDNTAVMRRLQM